MSFKRYSGLWGPGDNHHTSPTIVRPIILLLPRCHVCLRGLHGSLPQEAFHDILGRLVSALLCPMFSFLGSFSLLSFPLYLHLFVSLLCFCLFLSLAFCFSVSPFPSLPPSVSESLTACLPAPLSPSYLSVFCFLVSCRSLPLPVSLSLSLSLPGRASLLSQPLCCLLSPTLCLCGSACPTPHCPPFFPPLLVHVASADEMERAFLQRAGQKTAVSAGRSG